MRGMVVLGFNSYSLQYDGYTIPATCIENNIKSAGLIFDIKFSVVWPTGAGGSDFSLFTLKYIQQQKTGIYKFVPPANDVCTFSTCTFNREGMRRECKS